MKISLTSEYSFASIAISFSLKYSTYLSRVSITSNLESKNSYKIVANSFKVFFPLHSLLNSSKGVTIVSLISFNLSNLCLFSSDISSSFKMLELQLIHSSIHFLPFIPQANTQFSSSSISSAPSTPLNSLIRPVLRYLNMLS